jgi:carbon monoxide dehydrogenase subunit G
MHLSFAGSPDIAADRATVWRALLDPHTVARAASSIESVERVDDARFKLVAALGIGALKLRFSLQAELFDVIEPTSARLRVRGKAPGSTLDATTSFRLEELEPRRIRLHWKVDSGVGGTVASVGARLLEATVRRLTEEFWRDFAAMVSREAAA